MEQIHYNLAEHLRITRVEQFVSGKKFLLVHNRHPGDTDHAPPHCYEVWAIGTEFTSFSELDSRNPHNVRIGDSDHARENRWFFFYVSDEGRFLSYSCASDHGFTDSCSAHTMNYVLDLEDLTSRGIEILHEVSPGTDTKHYPDLFGDYDIVERAYL